MNSDFDLDFINLFNPETAKQAKQQFTGITYKKLYTSYPDIFIRGFNPNTRNGIRLINESNETITRAKEILQHHYLPHVLKDNNISLVTNTCQYLTRAGEIHTYTSHALYVKHRSTKFKDLEDSQVVKDVLKENISPIQKAARIKELLPNETKQYTTKQLYAWIYRNKDSQLDVDDISQTHDKAQALRRNDDKKNEEQ